MKPHAFIAMPFGRKLGPDGKTEVDFNAITSYQRYKLMASLIVPRPIALVTTLSPGGVVNAAPFSSYNYVATSPPMVAINIAQRASDGAVKDSARNILETREFVVNVATESTMELVHRSAWEYGPDVSERLIKEALHPYERGLIIATKGGMTRQGPNRWTPDCRPEHLRAACEASLKRLKLEAHPLYQLHAVDAKVPYADSVG